MVGDFGEDKQFLRDMETLSPREREIFWLLAEGCSYLQMGARLGIKLGTVRVHVHTVYRKLRVKSRGQAVAKLLRSQAAVIGSANRIP
jgi:DNA-binding CsgD family transcriptional regulator